MGHDLLHFVTTTVNRSKVPWKWKFLTDWWWFFSVMRWLFSALKHGWSGMLKMFLLSFEVLCCSSLQSEHITYTCTFTSIYDMPHRMDSRKWLRQFSPFNYSRTTVLRVEMFFVYKMNCNLKLLTSKETRNFKFAHFEPDGLNKR